MAIKRTITKELNIQTICNTANSFSICRGDSVDFIFTFKNGAEAFDISTATKARVFAKKFTSDGVNTLDTPFFSKEISLDNVTTISASFASEETAGESGNYLLSVILLDVEENTLTTQAIPFQVVNQGYAGVHQVSEDFRDEVLIAKQDSIKARNEAEDFVQQASEYAYTAETSASEASTSESNAFNFAESSRLYSENANTAESNALQYSQQAEEFKEQAEDFKEQAKDFKEQAKDFRDETLVARNEAILAKDEAVEISDPEGWRVNTRSMINALQQTKSNIGEFYFNGGGLQIDSLKYVQGNPFSFAVNFRANKADVIGIGKQVDIFDGGILYLYFPASNPRLAFYAPSGVLGVTYISQADNDRLLNGEWHSLVVSYDGTTLKLSDETGVLMSASATLQSQASSSAIKLGSNLVGQMRSIKYFNFDMSDVDAPYTIADYIAGKDESPLLQTTQPIIDWHNLNGGTRNGNTFKLSTTKAIYPCLFQNGTFKPNRKYSIDISGNVLYVNGQQNVGVRVRFPTAKVILTNKITGTVSEITTFPMSLALGNGTDFDVNVKFVANEESTDSNCMFYLNQSGSSNSYFTLSAQSVGALLSLEDYTFNGKVFDASGNNNTATITGTVYGTKDNTIEQMYQAFASRIQDLITSE